MPTGFTDKVLDGQITEFKDFAMMCSRAFGATIHMRDDSMDKAYEPRVPHGYHVERIAKAKADLDALNGLTDEEVVKNFHTITQDSINYYKEQKATAEANLAKMTAMLDKVSAWVPPTDEHKHFQEFMLDQLTQTIKWDCKSDYYEGKIVELNDQLTLEASVLRANELEDIDRSLAYHTKQHEDDIQRCNDANKWMSDLINSL